MADPVSKIARFDAVKAGSPVSKGELWDIVIAQDSIILTVLQAVVALRDGEREKVQEFSNEVMERLKKLDVVRDRLIYADDE